MNLARRLLLALLALVAAAPVWAATYNYRSDSFAWETAANAVTWDQTCTQYPRDDDKATISLTGGFAFRFAGTDYTSVRVLANGILQFGGDTGFHRNYTNTTLPAGSATARSGCVAGATVNTLFAYWTDLNPAQAGSGNVTWEQKGTAPNRRLVVSWNNVYQYNTSTPYAFQVILYEGGEFKYQYGNANATGARATIGVQVSASDVTLYSYNSGYNANGTAIRWSLANNDPARVAEYRFDEYAYTGRVGEVLDSSGNARHGVRVADAASHVSGRVCRALDVPANTDSSIDGVDSLVNADTTLGNAGGFSFHWRYVNAWSGGTAAMLLDATGSSGQPFFLQRDAGGALRLRITDSAGTILTATTSAQSFTAGTWVHIAASWRLASGSNQSTLRLYINGSLVASVAGTTTGQLAPSIASLFVGDARLGGAPSGGTSASANGRIDELRLYNYDIGLTEVLIDQAQSHSCLPPLDHLEIEHSSGSGLTCTPSTLTLRACANADCSVPYTDGVSGTLTAGAGATVVWPDGAGFVIPGGQSSVTSEVRLTTPGTVLLGATVVAASAATRCNFGNPSCSFSAADSGFQLSLADHRAELPVTLTVRAVRKSDNATVCVPAFASVSRDLSLGCAYVNPASGTKAVRVAGTALNASGNADAVCGTRTQALSFDANGQATASLQYADAGRFTVTARYDGAAATNDTGLVMTGSVSATAAPSDFAISNLPAGPLTAGVAFSARITARNASGGTTPNFGLEGETVQLSFARRQPTGAGASDGSFSGSASFSDGVANPANLTWSEVGRGDLLVALADGNYLATGLSVQGSTSAGATGALGPFRPHHLRATLAPACGSFSYAGQPMAYSVGAYNAAGALTRNYDAGLSPVFARQIGFSEAPTALALGAFDPATLAAADFSGGLASGQLKYGFTSKASGPGLLRLRVTDSDGVGSATRSDLEPSMTLRSGRLLLQSATGFAGQALNLPLRLEYWNGGSWVLSADDSCTAPVLTASMVAVAQSGRVDLKGVASAAWSSPPQSISLSAGVGQLRLASTGAGAVDAALNLGSGASDSACLPAPRPATTGANLGWLRSRQGSLHGCGTRETSDPSARASFGAATVESQRKVHERQID